jgi:excisionase family DNA binding protein
MQREFFEPKQAAEILHCSEAWLLTRAAVGEFPHLAWGKGKIVFTDEHLEEITQLREIRQPGPLVPDRDGRASTPAAAQVQASPIQESFGATRPDLVTDPETPTADWLSPKEICAQLQIPEQTFYQWRVKNLGPRAYRIGRHLRVSRTDFNAWLASRLEV